MFSRILVASAGLVLFVTAGCQQPQTVLNSLPDPAVRRDRFSPTNTINCRYAAWQHRTPIVSPLVQPFQPITPVRTASLGEAGWVPAIGISSRWTCLVIHHSASDRATPESMDRAHRQRGWDELGYHFVIGNGIGYPDGQVFVGSRWTKQKHGAHCKVPGNYYNEHGIGICLIGNLDEHPPTERQLRTLAHLVMFLEAQSGFGPDQIYTHGGITGRTRCPGRYFSLADLYHRLDVPMYARR